MVNRTVPPTINSIETLELPAPQLVTLENGVELYIIKQGEADVCRVDLLFHAGSKYQNKKLIATATTSLISEGTDTSTSQEIAEYFDFWGSFISTKVDKDFSRITAYSLTKFLPQTLEKLQHVITKASYPEQEVKIWSSRQKENLIVELEKTSTPARIELFRRIYGEQHPYGAFAQPVDYDHVTRSDLQDFHHTHFGSTNLTIVLSGSISNDEVGIVSNFFGQNSWGNSTQNSHTLPKVNSNTGQCFILKEKAVQSSIRIGREVCSPNDDDFTDLLVVTTVLGGYFGSRLMMNLREDKGYTYGINSQIVSFQHSAVLAISTEVGAQYTPDAINEIWKEIEILKTQLISNEELERVRSHLMGDLLRGLGDPFTTANVIIALIFNNNANFSLHAKMVDSIKSITPQRIMELSNKWLNRAEMVECVVGSNNPF